MTFVAFSPDGKTLASVGSQDGDGPASGPPPSDPCSSFTLSADRNAGYALTLGAAPLVELLGPEAHAAAADALCRAGRPDLPLRPVPRALRGARALREGAGGGCVAADPRARRAGGPRDGLVAACVAGHSRAAAPHGAPAEPRVPRQPDPEAQRRKGRPKRGAAACGGRCRPRGGLDGSAPAPYASSGGPLRRRTVERRATTPGHGSAGGRPRRPASDPRRRR